MYTVITQLHFTDGLPGRSIKHRARAVLIIKRDRMSRRIKNVWKDFVKWLQYEPHKTYMRGK